MRVDWIVVLYLADRCRHHVVLDQILTLSTLSGIDADVDGMYFQGRPGNLTFPH